MNVNKYLILFILAVLMINTETVLFVNCEMLINIVLSCLFALFFVLFNAHNFRNMFFYYPTALKRDLLLSQSFLLSVYRRSNMLSYRNRLLYIRLIRQVCRLIYKLVLFLVNTLFGILILQLYYYIESSLLFIFLYYSPVTQLLNTVISFTAYLNLEIIFFVNKFTYAV